MTVPSDCVPGDDWFEQPLVRFTMDRLGVTKGTADARTLLLAMHDTMRQLEERFPGIPFRDVYSCRPNHKQRVRRAMRAAGVSDADITLTLGPTTHRKRQGSRPKLPGHLDPEVYEKIRASASISQLADRMGLSYDRAEYLRSLRRPLTEKEAQALAVIEENPGLLLRQVAARVGVTRATVNRALGKQHYRQWLELNHPEDLAEAVA